MSGIVVNEELMMDLTSDYAQKYNAIPENHKQAVQWAYEQGKAKAIDEFAVSIPNMEKETAYFVIGAIAKRMKGGAV